MGGGAVLDPFAYDSTLADLTRRVEWLEGEPKVYDPIILQPRRVGTPSPYNDFYAVTTSATFETLFTTVVPVVALPGLYCSVLMTDSGATGEVRVVLTNGSGTVTSVVHSYPAGGNQNTLAWLHGLPTWTGGAVTVNVQGRRASGAGGFYCNRPSLGFVNVQTLRSAGGVWYAGVWLP